MWERRFKHTTIFPVAEHGFFLNVKADFHDHIHLRYCWLWTICLPSVLVEINTRWVVSRSANCLVSSTCGIMILSTSWHHAWKKFTMKLRLSQSCNHWRVNLSLVQSPILTQMPELISGYEDFGLKAITHFLTHRYSIPSCEAIGLGPLSPSFSRWRETKRNSMEIG